MWNEKKSMLRRRIVFWYHVKLWVLSPGFVKPSERDESILDSRDRAPLLSSRSNCNLGRTFTIFSDVFCKQHFFTMECFFLYYFFLLIFSNITYPFFVSNCFSYRYEWKQKLEIRKWGENNWKVTSTSQIFSPPSTKFFLRIRRNSPYHFLRLIAICTAMNGRKKSKFESEGRRTTH